MSSVRISVAMATCNGAPFLREQLNSLAEQRLVPIELQIGDDGSTDETEGIVRSFAERSPFPVHFERNIEALGYGENFIRTALRCRGDWIAFCDQDDVWLPEKLSCCAKEIAHGPSDLRLVAHNAMRTDDQLRPTGSLYSYPVRALHISLDLPPEWYCIGLTQIIEARMIREIPATPRVSFPWHPHRGAHDVWAALLANATGSILLLGESLALYRRHGSTVTVTAEPGGFGEIRALLQNNGDNFAARSAYLAEVAATLEVVGDSAPAPFGEKLHAAASKIRLQSHNLERRTAVYCAETRAKRFETLRLLMAEGGYFGSAGWPFGPRRLLKDLFYALRS